MIRKTLLLAGVAAFGLLAQPALAQTSPIRGKQAGDFLIGASVLGVMPMSGGDVDMIGGSPHADTAWTGQLDFTYFFTSNISVNLIAATTRHDLEVRHSALGTVDLGHAWILPPTLTVQFHPLPSSRFSPYIGAGVNWSMFYSEGGGRNPIVTDVDVRNEFGFALNVGMDIEIAPNWLMNIDLKKLFLRPDVRVDTVVGRINATADLDPWIVGVGLRYRF